MFKTKLLAVILAVAMGSVLQIEFKSIFGWSPDFALGVLVLVPFYLNFLETGVCALVGAFSLNWRPGLSQEILVFILLPFLVLVSIKQLPFRKELSGAVAALLSILIFYAASDFHFLFENPIFVIQDVLVILPANLVLFWVLDNSFEVKQKR